MANNLLRVGVVQTVTNKNSAWTSSYPAPLVMSVKEEAIAVKQLRSAISTLLDERVDVILAPELSVPWSEVRSIGEWLAKRDVLFAGGADYRNRVGGVVENVALFLVPKSWKQGVKSSWSYAYRVPKIYPAPMEVLGLQKAGYKFHGKKHIYIFQSKCLGAIGLCVCYDLMDLQRALLYRGRIDHLFVVAYNQDFTSFQHIAESYARTIYCNVVICNTGFYGGSLAVSPYHDRIRRTRFRHQGASLFTHQVFEIPCDDIQNVKLGEEILDDKKKPIYKARPPSM